MTGWRMLLGGLVAISLALIAAEARGQDREAAERQYRIARRLAAEGSPQATEALRRVVELDPAGPLADDALVEQALLEPLPRWPENLGFLEPAQADRAAALLGRVLRDHGPGDRAHEARYYRALLRLEPLHSHDPSAARLDLLALATNPDAGAWGTAARYVVAWVAEQRGDAAAARSAYQRLVIETPAAPGARRAMLGLARLDLGQGQPGRAASGIQAVLADDGTPHAAALGLRDLAVGTLLRSTTGLRASPAPEVMAETAVRTLAGFVAMPDGGLLVADKREGVVIALDARGETRARWEVEAPQAVAVNALGRIVAAAGDQLFLLAPGKPLRPVASLGSLAPLSALAMDALGGLWLLDRRGERIVRIEPGSTVPVTVWQSEGARLVAIAWDGRRLVAVDERSKSILGIGPGGARQVLAEGLRRPVAIASDLAGRLAILEAKLGQVVFVAPGGAREADFSTEALGVERPIALDFGPDGALHLFDGASGSWVRVP